MVLRTFTFPHFVGGDGKAAPPNVTMLIKIAICILKRAILVGKKLKFGLLFCLLRISLLFFSLTLAKNVSHCSVLHEALCESA